MLEYTTFDGNTKGLAEYEIYPEMVFLPPEQPGQKAKW